MRIERFTAAVSLTLVVIAAAYSQTNAEFHVNLSLDFSAAEQTLALYSDQFINTQSLAELRGNQIAASTAGMVANDRSVALQLLEYLDSLKYHQIIRQDIYHLEDARRNISKIQQLLDELKRTNFSERVVATVEQIFPADAVIDLTIPVYVVALGHENVDAFVRRIVWHGDVPQFVGENDGELTIVINIARSVDYGSTGSERFVSLLGVVAHEVFHAAFAAYKEHSSSWKRFYRSYQRPFDALLDLTQNEGIAYYLSLDQQGRGRVPRDWDSRTSSAIAAFNQHAGELLAPTITQRRVAELLRTANLSGYWESYGAMTGMFIARIIDQRLGRSALIETISSDPYDFFEKYSRLTKVDSNLPKLSPSVLTEIGRN